MLWDQKQPASSSLGGYWNLLDVKYIFRVVYTPPFGCWKIILQRWDTDVEQTSRRHALSTSCR